MCIKNKVIVVLKAICLVIALLVVRPLEYLCQAIWSGCKAIKLYCSYAESPLPTKKEWKEYIDYLKEEWDKK